MRLKYSAIILSLLVLCVVVMGSSCAEKIGDSTQKIVDISAEEAFNLIQDNEGNSDFIIMDVRTPEEFADGHIENAINLDFYSESFKAELSKLDRNKTYLVYCRTGNRSSSTIDIMSELGFKEVYHLDVGIVGWLDKGLPTIIQT
ncbi:rhodanese-like domain-containing protein [Chloroflexota bacterium]